MRAQATNTVRRARRIILCLWTAGIIYCSPWLLLSTTMPKRLDDGRSISACTFTLPRGQYLIYYMADLIIFYAVPLLTATVLYGLIARTLYSAVGGPTNADGGSRGSMRSTGDSISVGGGKTMRFFQVSTFRRRSGVGGARYRRSTFFRQQSSMSMSSANASNSRIQVGQLSSFHALKLSSAVVTFNQNNFYLLYFFTFLYFDHFCEFFTCCVWLCC